MPDSDQKAFTVCVHATVVGTREEAEDAGAAMEMQGERFDCQNIMVEVIEQKEATTHAA